MQPLGMVRRAKHQQGKLPGLRDGKVADHVRPVRPPIGSGDVEQPQPDPQTATLARESFVGGPRQGRGVQSALGHGRASRSAS